MRKRIVLTGTKELAQSVESELRKMIKTKPEPRLTEARVDDLFPEYLEWYKLNRAPSSYEDIERLYRNQFKKHLGYFRIRDLTRRQIEYYQKIRTSQVSNRTVTKELHYFSGFLTWCEKHFDYKRSFRIEKLPYKSPIPIILSFDEVVRFIENSDTFYRAFFLCLYSLGLRFSEARFIKREDIDMENFLLRVKQKGGSYKVLPLNKWVSAALQEIMPESGYVFASKWRRGQPIRDVRGAIRRARIKAKITKKIYPHLLRHSVATHLLGKNINMRTIQIYLGHSQLSSTEFYTHVMTEHLREASKALMLDLPEKRKDVDYT